MANLTKKASNTRLRTEYGVKVPLAERLTACLCEQLSTLLVKNDITLGVPMESRVKTWSSIEEKLSRNALSLASVESLQDIVGLRLILLFRDDIPRLDTVINRELDVISSENTADRLDEAQFGYQSNHYIVRIPAAWEKIPSYVGLRGLTAEIQVRSLAQHIWAAASHKLQYKREDSVPPPLRRTIYRVSALLETVDLEFSRILAERSAYVRDSAGDLDAAGPLNVDILAAGLARMWPEASFWQGMEDYDELVRDLVYLGVASTHRLADIIEKRRDAVLAEDRKQVDMHSSSKFLSDRVGAGVYFTQCGLTREALRMEFGEAAVDEAFQARGKGPLELKFEEEFSRAEDNPATPAPPRRRSRQKK